MCQLYVKVSQTLVDQMMDSFCRPMLEQNGALGNKRLLFLFWGGGGRLSDFFLHHEKKRLLSGGGYFRRGGYFRNFTVLCQVRIVGL